NSEENEEEPSIVSVDKEGFTVQETSVYDKANSDEGIDELPLFTFVDVVETVDEDYYKVTYDDQTGYVFVDDMNIDEKPTNATLDMEEVLPFVTDEFSEAYLYYLSYLDETVAKIEEEL